VPGETGSTRGIVLLYDAYYIHGTSKIASRVQNEIVAGLRDQFRNEQAEAASKPKGRA